jgi:hypothetical protein
MIYQSIRRYKMKKLCFLLVVMCILAGSVFAAVVTEYADVSCRTRSDDTSYLVNGDSDPGDGSTHDSVKLSIRNSGRGEKSWIRFDLNPDVLSTARSAQLRITLHESKTGSADLSAVNDDCHDNDNWADSTGTAVPEEGIGALTWNNAPGNDIADWGALDAAKTTFLERFDYDGAAGDQFFIDVSTALQADTDGIVQFVLHDSTGDTKFSTHDHTSGEEYWPALLLKLPPEGADWPEPEDGAVVPVTLPSLSWTNPDPNDGSSSITCTVWLGTEPNRIGNMESVLLGTDVSSVAINTTNFPTYGSLTNNTLYYWFVDCEDPSPNRVPSSIPGEEWSFYVGQAPSVDAGPDQTLWLDPGPSVVVSLDGTTSDDGSYTVLWTQEGNGAPAVTISPDNVDDTTVTITERGDYEFTLTATETGTEGLLATSDTVRIVVGDDACDASHIDSGAEYNAADENQDCIVDLADFVALIATNWLNCTDTLTTCGQ